MKKQFLITKISKHLFYAMLFAVSSCGIEQKDNEKILQMQFPNSKVINLEEAKTRSQIFLIIDSASVKVAVGNSDALPIIREVAGRNCK